jgi:branched-chain amino acid transport system ATP-binding protein
LRGQIVRGDAEASADGDHGIAAVVRCVDGLDSPGSSGVSRVDVGTISAGSSSSDATAMLLELREVSVRFGGITALDSVSFDVNRGQICGLIGPNGAGKTTLFDVVSGVRRPQRGWVSLDGVDISSFDPVKRCQAGLRRTFQRFQMFGWLTVEDNVLAAIEWHGGGGGFVGDMVGWPGRRRRERERRRLVDEALERCGLTGVRREFAGSLPIGTARMVEFARATVEPPKLLLLDEPASGLHSDEVARLGEQIMSIRSETGCTVLLVEHNAGFVMQHCDRVVVLALGSVLADGFPSEIQNDAAVRSAYLGEVVSEGSSAEAGS